MKKIGERVKITVDVGGDIIDSTTVRQYKNVIVPISEAIINSYEENASRVDIITYPSCPDNQFIVSDNGLGMDDTVKAKAFCSFFKSIKPKGAIGQFGLGSKFWAGIGNRAIIKTSPYAEINSPMFQLEVMRDVFYKKSMSEWSFEGVWVYRDHLVPTGGTFTRIEVFDVFEKIQEAKLLDILPELAPIGGNFEIFVNGKKVKPRQYQGKPFTAEIEKRWKKEAIKISFEIYLIEKPTRLDIIRLRAMGRKIADIAQLKSELDVPSVFYETGLAGFVSCDALNQCVTTSRGEISSSHPVVELLVEALWEVAPSLQELLNSQVEVEEAKEYNEVALEIAKEMSKVLQTDEKIREEYFLQLELKCLVCKQERAMRRCPALKFDKICFKCCFASWGNIKDRIQGCNEECRHFGKRYERHDEEKKIPTPKDRNIPAVIRFHGHTLKVKTHPLYKVPSQLNRTAETIIINTDHYLFQWYYKSRGMKHTWREWIRQNIALRITEYLGIPINEEALTMTFHLMEEMKK